MKSGVLASWLCLALGIARIAEAEAASGASGDSAASSEALPAEEGTTTPDSSRTAQPSAEGTARGGSKGAARGDAQAADEQFGHGMQFGLRAALTGGYRMVFRYDKSPFCKSPDPAKSDKDQQKFCGHGAPLALDLGLSFAPLDFVEPYVWGRFGLTSEAETNTDPVIAFGAGARIYTMSDSRFKIFIEPAVGIEVEGGAGDPSWRFRQMMPAEPEYKTDFLFHLAVGGQYDFARAVGAYVNAGLTTGILRYIHTGLEISGGVQVRVP